MGTKVTTPAIHPTTDGRFMGTEDSNRRPINFTATVRLTSLRSAPLTCPVEESTLRKTPWQLTRAVVSGTALAVVTKPSIRPTLAQHAASAWMHSTRAVLKPWLRCGPTVPRRHLPSLQLPTRLPTIRFLCLEALAIISLLGPTSPYLRRLQIPTTTRASMKPSPLGSAPTRPFRTSHPARTMWIAYQR